MGDQAGALVVLDLVPFGSFDRCKYGHYTLPDHGQGISAISGSVKLCDAVSVIKNRLNC